MPLINANGAQVFFCHVLKTGGSSVEEYLVRRFGGPLSIRDRNKRKGIKTTGVIGVATHLTAQDLVEFLPPDLAYSFALVRDPLSRVKSQFGFQAGISRTSRLSFSTWLRVMLHAVRLDPRVYQNHIRPQSDLVPEGSEIFRLEDGFDAMIARLDEVTRSTAPEQAVGHLLKRKKSEVKVYRQDAALISDFYAADYARFGYRKPDLSSFESDPRAMLRDLPARLLARAVVAKQHRDWVS
jgi:hypothetical protein